MEQNRRHSLFFNRKIRESLCYDFSFKDFKENQQYLAGGLF